MRGLYRIALCGITWSAQQRTDEEEPGLESTSGWLLDDKWRVRVQSTASRVTRTDDQRLTA